MRRRLERLGFRDRRLVTGEIELHYVEGPASGPPLVLIPGQSMTWESYGRALPLLAPHFRVFAVDVRGHGGSTWTPGEYDFPRMGGDVHALLERVVRRPAVVSGNSSGGLIALWLAANEPDLVAGIVMEDAPVFSAEWPRLRDDCWVYGFFERVVEAMTAPGGRDLAGLFGGMRIPVQGGHRLVAFPRWIAGPLGWAAGIHERLRPGEPVDLFFLPPEVRLVVKCLTAYDPEFTRAFLDGSACAGFVHAEALRRVRCPVMYLQADWFRVAESGLLLGAADDADIERLRVLVPDLEYRRIGSGHMIHFEKPETYVHEVREFADGL